MKTFKLFSILAFFISTLAEAKIYIDITNVSDKSFPIALVPLVQDGGGLPPEPVGEKFMKLLQSDLELMGVFRFIPQTTFLEPPNTRTWTTSNVDFANWAVLDALALVKGWFKYERNKVILEPHLFDVLLKQELIAKRYEGTLDQLPSMVHRFANEIMKILAGDEGIFDTRIAFISKQTGAKELYAMDFNGDNLAKLTNDRSIVLSPKWSRDAKSIFYTSFGNIKIPQLFRYDFSRRGSSSLGKLPGMVISLSLDPLGNGLAATLTKDGNPEIYMLGMNGSPNERLTKNVNEIDVSPSFSPDGKQIVFVSNRDDNHAQIFRMDRDGGNAKRLTYKGLNNTAPAWSPRGDKIAFAGMDKDGLFDIFTMNADGSAMLRLTYDSRNNQEPSWSPDGNLIAFSSSRTGKYQIYIMRADGSHQVQLTKLPGDNEMAAWGPRIK